MATKKNDHLKLAAKSRDLPAWKKAIRFLFRLALLIAILLMLRHGETFFRVSEIRIEGAGETSPGEILAAAEIRKGMNIFLIQGQAVSEKIRKQLPRIKEVDISRSLPDKIVISVSERVPAVYAVTNNGFWLIDQDAFCFAYVTESAEDYPLLVGMSDELIMPGTFLTCPVRKEALVEYFSVWPGGTGLEIAEINFYNKYNLIVFTVEGLEIWLGDSKEMESKLTLIQRSIPYINTNSGTHLDARSGKRLIVSKSAVTGVKEVDP